MSSVLELTWSVTKLCATALPPLPNRTLLQSSPVTLGSSVALPSSSNRPLGRGSPLPVPPSVPKMSKGTTALTVIEAVAPPARLELLAVRKPLELIEDEPNVLEATHQVSKVASGSWSVTSTLLAGPAPVFDTVMGKEAVSPGWMTSPEPGVTALVISRLGSRVTLADAWALMTLLKLP